MSITYPSAIARPNGIVANLPNALIRPNFEELYGFDNVDEDLGTPNIAVVQFGDDGATISTSGVSGATSYTYERDTDPGFSNPLIISSGTLDLTVNNTGFTKGVTHYYRIRATDGVDTTTSATASILLLATFTTSVLVNGATALGNTNPLTLTIRPEATITAGSTLTLAGLSGSQTATNVSLTIAGTNAAVFGSSASWNSNGTLVLTVDTGQSIPNNADTVITFELTNPASISSGVSSVTLSSSGYTLASISGTFLNTVATFNVTQRDTEANLLLNPPSLSAGEAGIAFGTNTNDFYIYDGNVWYIFNNDS